MLLTIKNFGGFDLKVLTINSDTCITLPNGAGKTTIINAYVFALSGKALSGFEPRRVNTPKNDYTEVILKGVLEEPIRRTLSPSGETALYYGDNVISQSKLETMIDVAFCVACANVNVLTNPALTSEQLRKLLSVAEVLHSEEREALLREQKTLREERRTAEQYSLSNVRVPEQTYEPITQSEDMFKSEYERKSCILNEPTREKCFYCGAPFSPERIEEERTEKREAREFVERNFDEYVRICDKNKAYEREKQEIEIAQRMLDTAKQARSQLLTIDARLADIETELRELDAKAIRTALPDGVEIVTEKTAKNGKSSSVCTLTHNGVPLKSVNRGMRIAICVRMLADARTRKGVNVPIIVDNAESVQGIDDIPNLIQFKVGMV
mgnify:CR=1 FL=1